jgi:DNA-binding transcriptional regulator YhcF (GntR family)
MSVPVYHVPNRLLVLAAVSEAWALKGRAPSLREIGKAVGIGAPRVQNHLRMLEAAGVVTWERHRNGTIRLVRKRR